MHKHKHKHIFILLRMLMCNEIFFPPRIVYLALCTGHFFIFVVQTSIVLSDSVSVKKKQQLQLFSLIKIE